MDAASAEVFKITVKNSKNNEIVAYVLPEGKQKYVRTMMEEYGNAVVEPMMMGDLPSDVEFDYPLG
jgi:16S rRNA U516 pseudouridylate synthase RsuA-like enzyme